MWTIDLRMKLDEFSRTQTQHCKPTFQAKASEFNASHLEKRRKRQLLLPNVLIFMLGCYSTFEFDNSLLSQTP